PQPRRIPRPLCLPELPAQAKRIGESLVRSSEAVDAWKYQVELPFEQVLQEACRDRRTEVLIGMSSPPPNKSPPGLGYALDELTDGDDRLPAWIPPAVGRGPTRQNGVGLTYRLDDSHRRSQANDLPFSGERRTVAASVTRQRGGAGTARAVAAQAHRQANDAGVRPLQRLVGRRRRTRVHSAHDLRRSRHHLQQRFRG